jgi:dihydrofolate reductase
VKISAIVAMSENRVIGKSNRLPWNIPEDLKHFRKVTSGHPIVMGRKTFESIGRVLPGRENIVISRTMTSDIPGLRVVRSLEEAITSCQGKAEEIFIIGGGEIYRMALPKVDRIYLTLVHQEIEGDAFFPEIPSDQFKQVSSESRTEPLKYSFLVLDRI